MYAPRQPINKTVKQIIAILHEQPGTQNEELQRRLGRSVDRAAALARAQIRLQNHRATPPPAVTVAPPANGHAEPVSDVPAALALLADALRKENKRLVRVVVETVITEDLYAPAAS